MDANTKTPVLPISYKLGFPVQGAQRSEGGRSLGWKRVLSVSSHLQAHPVPPEQQNNLNHGLMVHLVSLDPHCKCMK